MRMIFIFIDGFGLGENDKEKNPIVAANTPNLDYIFERFTVIPTETTLGVKGLPQSATGQTTIFTGKNASELIGVHLSGQPTESLKKVIIENNIFKALLDKGFKVTNSNVYRQEYLDKMQVPIDRRHRPSVTSVMTMSSGIKFRRVEEFEAGLGIYHDITGQILKDSGYNVDLITPEEAAERLYRISRDFDFTLYEHFMTDIIGHTMDMERAISQIELLDAFLGRLLGLIDLKEDTIFITSDHGNIEDISVKTHTYNKVPTIIIGKVPEGLEVKIESLLDIMPAVMGMFEGDLDEG
jgi:2,3-bisphosphoglycerate-independent phosphoglycerate mutase